MDTVELVKIGAKSYIDLNNYLYRLMDSDSTFKDNTVIKIKCDCNRGYVFTKIEDLPRRSLKCPCGVWIVKYENE